MTEAFDLVGPYAGPCLFCDHSADKRHRVYDSIVSFLNAGESPEVIATEFPPISAENIRQIAVIEHISSSFETEKTMSLDEAKLGLATTRELLTEVAVRMEVTQNSLKGEDLGCLCREALDNLDPLVLDYSTVHPSGNGFVIADRTSNLETDDA